MEFFSDLLKAPPNVIILVILLVVAYYIGKYVSNRSSVPVKKEDNLGKLIEVLGANLESLNDAINRQTAAGERRDDALISIKVGVDTLILDKNEAELFRNELKARLIQAGNCQELLDRLDKLPQWALLEVIPRLDRIEEKMK